MNNIDEAVSNKEHAVICRLTKSPVHESVFNPLRMRGLIKNGLVMNQVETYFLTSKGRLYLECLTPSKP